MDSKDEKNKDNQPPELPPSEQTEEPLIDAGNILDISQKKSATTQSVAESLLRIRNQLGDDAEQQKSSITLNVLGVDTPITLYDKNQITIGRKNPANNEHPDVDLSGLPLNAAGISRKHVKLVYTTGQWYVEDLGSRNGTWLNNKLLMAYQRYKMRDGDQLRTGGISIIVILHADEPQSEKPKPTSKSILPDRLELTSSAIIENQQGLSPHYITHHLMAYLNAVIEMIQHVDRAKKRPQREISIVSIEFNQPIITARLNCSHEVLQFMSGQSIVTLLSEPLSQFIEATPAMQPINSTSESPTTSVSQSTEMARQFAEEYFPLITPDQSLYYQRLIAPLLKVCIESDLRIVI